MKCSHPGFRMNVGCKECTIETCEARLRTPKPLAQFLDEYIQHEYDEDNIGEGVNILYAWDSWLELLEQAIEAYQSTEQVTIEITKL